MSHLDHRTTVSGAGNTSSVQHQQSLRSKDLQQSPNKLSKDEKRKAIKELLKQKLGITNIHEIEIGQKLNFDCISRPSPPTNKNKQKDTPKGGLSGKNAKSPFSNGSGSSKGGDFSSHVQNKRATERRQIEENSFKEGTNGGRKMTPMAQKRLNNHQQNSSSGSGTVLNATNLKFRDIYQFRGVLGHGQYGVVLLVINIHAKELRALKILYKNRLCEEELDILKSESEILEQLSVNKQKSNVVQSYQMFESLAYIFIEMEYIAGEQLKKIYDIRLQTARKSMSTFSPEDIEERRQQALFRQQMEALNYDDQPTYDLLDETEEQLKEPLFSEEETAKIIKGILQGLTQVHGYDIIHRDLKPENIMIRNSELKPEAVVIVDFGLSAKFKAQDKFSLDDKIGTVLFMAPEQISQKNYGKKIDMYACGVIAYYFLCGRHPLFKFGDTQITFKNKLLNIGPDKWIFPPFISDLAKDFISRLCKIASVQRYDAKKALLHPWITRNFADKIPLNRIEELQQTEVHQTLTRMTRIATFLTIVKQYNIKKQLLQSAGNPQRPEIHQIVGSQHSTTDNSSNIDQQYLRKLKRQYEDVQSRGTTSRLDSALRGSQISQQSNFSRNTDDQGENGQGQQQNISNNSRMAFQLQLPSIFKGQGVISNGGQQIGQTGRPPRPDGLEGKEFTIRKRNTVALKEVETSIKKKRSENHASEELMQKSPSELYPSKIGTWAPQQNSENIEYFKQKQKPQNLGIVKPSNGSPLKIPSSSFNEGLMSQNSSSISPIKARHFRSGKNSDNGGMSGLASSISHILEQHQQYHFQSAAKPPKQDKYNIESSLKNLETSSSPTPYQLSNKTNRVLRKASVQKGYYEEQKMIPLSTNSASSQAVATFQLPSPSSQKKEKIQYSPSGLETGSINSSFQQQQQLSLRLTKCIDDQPSIQYQATASIYGQQVNLNATVGANKNGFKSILDNYQQLSSMPPIQNNSSPVPHNNSNYIPQINLKNNRAYRNASGRDQYNSIMNSQDNLTNNRVNQNRTHINHQDPMLIIKRSTNLLNNTADVSQANQQSSQLLKQLASLVEHGSQGAPPTLQSSVIQGPPPAQISKHPRKVTYVDMGRMIKQQQQVIAANTIGGLNRQQLSNIINNQHQLSLQSTTVLGTSIKKPAQQQQQT